MSPENWLLKYPILVKFQVEIFIFINFCIGMSKLLTEEYYNSSSDELPYKWASPEVLLYKKYSTHSGILLYY